MGKHWQINSNGLAKREVPAYKNSPSNFGQVALGSVKSSLVDFFLGYVTESERCLDPAVQILKVWIRKNL